MLRQILARGFRNLEPLDWSIEPGSHLLLGGTGAGKTSVLEAVYVVATTRSFRAVQLADCARRSVASGAAAEEGGAPDPDGFCVAAEVVADARVRIELAWSVLRGLERRCNGERVPLARHVAAQPVLAWTAGEVEMLLGSPTARRRFLDRGVVYERAGALESFAAYRRLLAQKRALLRDGGSRRELSAWNTLLAEAAATITAQRAAFVAALREVFATVASRSGLPVAELVIQYRPSPREATEGAGTILDALERSLAGELDARRPLLGPHRDHLVLRWQGAEIAQRASAGERKAIGLLLLAAQAGVIRKQHDGIVLLVDDADAELDRATLRAVWPVLAEHPQVLATSNRPEAWHELHDGARWRLERGRIDAFK